MTNNTGGDAVAMECTEVGVNQWALDLTLLPYVLGLPPTTITTTGLTKTWDFILSLYDVDDISILDVDVNSVPTIYCFGYPVVGVSGGMSTVLTTGYSRPIYHNGRYCKFVTSAYSIISTTTSTTGITYIAPNADHKEIAWIDRDGKWSFWNFRYLSQSNENKASNEIPFYSLTNDGQVMSSYDITMESNLMLNFDTVAVNSDHYQQLTEISKSPRVIYNGLCYRVKSCNNDTADCRQNLHFNLTLQSEQNAVSY
jgi:hypothetical protein